MEKLIAAQQELYARMTRTYDNLKKTGAAKITRALISSSLKVLDSKWEKFAQNHEVLLGDYAKELIDHSYVKEDLFEQAENVYVYQRSVLLDVEKNLPRAKECKPVPGDTAGPKTTLPRIQLPSFTGRYEDWPSFRDLFVSLIGRDGAVTDVEKLHYLKACLKGEAEQLVKNIPTTAENFGRAWIALQEFYENKRLLVRSIYSTFTSFAKMKGESASDLRKLYHRVTSTVGALEGIGRPIASSEDLFVFLAADMLDARSRRDWEDSLSDTTVPPNYTALKQFLERRLHTLEAVQGVKSEGNATKSEATPRTARVHHAGNKEKSKSSCPACNENHFVMVCATYKAKTANERKQVVDANNLCFNCLGKHRVAECPSKRTCSVCGEKHRSSLHDAYRAVKEISPATTAHAAQPRITSGPTIILATARVRIIDRFGAFHSVRALVDQGSEASFASESLAQRLRLTRVATRVRIFGIGGLQTGVSRGAVNVEISPAAGGAKISVQALVLPRLTAYAGAKEVKERTWAHLTGLTLADPEYASNEPIELLLGAEVFSAILLEGVRKGGPREPVAQETSLSWLISGIADADNPPARATVHHCAYDDELTRMVRLFWEQEELPRAAAPLSPDEQACEDLFVTTHSRSSDGRYTVRLPLRSPLPDFSGTRHTAVRSLFRMEARFQRDAELQQQYVQFMRDYESLLHMTPVDPRECAPQRVCYLPHHGVIKAASTTTNLRVVN
ncbi:uncharacterized protein [Temnothorax nylanderi]|uniref:uncharacterized protein n=1 Tax=Temnothorax nylanderi TaxID=102681 RepID=UPI003A865E51